MQRAEQEIEHDAVDQHRGQEPEPSAARKYEPCGGGQHDRVTGQLPESERIGALRQASQGIAIETPGIGPGFLRHQRDSSAAGAMAERRPASNLKARSAGMVANMTYQAGAYVEPAPRAANHARIAGANPPNSVKPAL
jgi:hypothetical protein